MRGRGNTGGRALGWVAGVALVTVAPMLAGCSSGGAGNAAASSSAGSSASAGAAASSGAAAPTGAAPSSSAGGASAQAVVAKWVTAVVEGHAKQACKLMAQPSTGSSPAQPASAELCAGKGAQGQQVLHGVAAFRKAFAPQHAAAGQPAVRVSAVPVQGDSAVVPAKDITVDGQPLDAVILSNSTGIKPGQLQAKADAARIGGSWYVTGFDFNIGGSAPLG